MATHTDEQLDFVLDAVGRIGRKYEIVGSVDQIA
jgi:hypothetical protein